MSSGRQPFAFKLKGLNLNRFCFTVYCIGSELSGAAVERASTPVPLSVQHGKYGAANRDLPETPASLMLNHWIIHDTRSSIVRTNCPILNPTVGALITTIAPGTCPSTSAAVGASCVLSSSYIRGVSLILRKCRTFAVFVILEWTCSKLAPRSLMLITFHGPVHFGRILVGKLEWLCA